MPQPLQPKNDIKNNADVLASSETTHSLLTVRIQDDVRKALKKQAYMDDKKQWEIIDAALRAYLQR